MYIRTKNRIYQVESTLRDNGIVKGYNIGEMAFIREDQVIKPSQNPEELCDEFVMTHYFPETDYTKREVLKEDKDLMIKAVKLKKQNNKDKDLKNEFNIYGCIWVEIKLPNNKSAFRLEPVAIMNEKGELELI